MRYKRTQSASQKNSLQYTMSENSSQFARNNDGLKIRCWNSPESLNHMSKPATFCKGPLLSLAEFTHPFASVWWFQAWSEHISNIWLAFEIIMESDLGFAELRAAFRVFIVVEMVRRSSSWRNWIGDQLPRWVSTHRHTCFSKQPYPCLFCRCIWLLSCRLNAVISLMMESAIWLWLIKLIQSD